MSSRRKYSEGTLRVMERFFVALDVCVEHRIFSNLTKFCDEYGIDRRHLCAQRKDLNKGYFEVGWLQPLVDNGISCVWLLTGKGSMFDPSRVSVFLKPCVEVIS